LIAPKQSLSISTLVENSGLCGTFPERLQTRQQNHGDIHSRKLTDGWQWNTNITGFSHDQHTSATALLNPKGLKSANYPDRNDVIGSWERGFQKYRWIQLIRKAIPG
jgi:hypothetical protein